MMAGWGTRVVAAEVRRCLEEQATCLLPWERLRAVKQNSRNTD